MFTKIYAFLFVDFVFIVDLHIVDPVLNYLMEWGNQEDLVFGVVKETDNAPSGKNVKLLPGKFQMLCNFYV